MQVLVNGLIAGLPIALLALAFSTVYIPSRVFHVALGGVYAATPFVAWECLRRGWHWAAALVAALGIALALSVACEALNHWRLERQGAPPGVHLIASLGLYLILVQAISMLWGPDIKVLREGTNPTVQLGGIMLTRTQGIVTGTCLAMFGAFFLWLRCTNTGLHFRALAENPREFALRGHALRSARLFAFALSGGLAATAALVVAYDVGFDPEAGLPALLLAVAAVIIGGRYSFLGAAIGGVLLGAVRTEVVWFLSARWQEGVTFLLLAAFLLVRPNGIIGRAVRLEGEV